MAFGMISFRPCLCPEKVRKHITEPSKLKSFPEIMCSEPFESGTTCPELCAAELVIFGFLLRVAKHLIRFIDFFELRFGNLVPGVQVRVIFTRELSVSFFDLIR